MLTGGCFCRAIRYETAATPADETVCHCTDCRRATGATAVAWFTVPAAALNLVAGTPRSFRSSPGVTRSFCSACGTSLFYRTEPGTEVDVATASLDDPDAVPPKDHVQTADRPRWVALPDDLPIYPRARGA